MQAKICLPFTNRFFGNRYVCQLKTFDNNLQLVFFDFGNPLYNLNDMNGKKTMNGRYEANQRLPS